MPEEKKALKGLRGVRLWPITANNATTYTTGAKIELPSAQKLTKTVQRQDYTIYADDVVYDTGSEYQYEDLVLTLAELPVDIESKIAGGTYDETDKTYTFKTDDAAPAYALGYAGLMLSKKFRMFKHYCVKLMSVKVEHSSKGANNDISAYEVTFRNTQRVADSAVRITKDSDTTDLDWLDTIENLPAA